MLGLALSWWQVPATAAPDQNSAKNCAIAISGSVENGSTISNICGISPEVLSALTEEIKEARVMLQDSNKALQNLTDEQKAEIDELRQILDLTNGQIRMAFETLGEKNIPTDQLASKLVEMARRYNDLRTLLDESSEKRGASGQDATLLQIARDLLQDGNLDAAQAIFDRLIQSDEADVERAADDHFARASILALQFRFDEALADYAKAYQYRPGDLRYAEAYATALLNQRDYLRAETVLTALLTQREASAKDLNALEKVANTLAELEIVYSETQRLDDAQAVLTKALKIERSLAEQNPVLFAPFAKMLENLGALYDQTKRPKFANAAFSEAVGIWRSMAEQNPGYQPDFAVALSNLGNFLSKNHLQAEAEAAFKQSRDIYISLSVRNRAEYRPELSLALNNLGVLYDQMGRFDEANSDLKCAIKLRRELVVLSPAKYSLDLAWSLGNLGNLYVDMQLILPAETAYKESLDIGRKLTAQNPTAYRLFQIRMLRKLASFYRKMQRESDAEPLENEAQGLGK
jgi:tetratricopeptide (TPR) repeat protein